MAGQKGAGAILTGFIAIQEKKVCTGEVVEQ